MRGSFICLVATAMCASACDRTSHARDDSGVAPSDTVDGDVADVPANGNLPPIANAGPDAKHLVGVTFALDGTASTDPDGVVVSHAWSIEARPSGSTATLVDELAATASFTADLVGSYRFRLLVTDDEGATGQDTVTVVVPTLSVDAGPDQTVVWHSTVQLAGSYVSDCDPTTLAWQFVTRPTTSTTQLQAASSTTPAFYADKVGTFVVELAVTNPAGTLSDTTTVTVVPPPPYPVDGNIVDVDIGYAGQLVIASTNPNRIRTLDPVYPLPPQEMEIPLTVTPTAIGVSETGEFVSIIHDGTRLTRSRIPSLQQLNTINTHTTLFDVRHGSANPHAFPAQAGPVMLVDYTAGNVTSGGLVAGLARGRQIQDGSYALYVIELGASQKLRRFDAGQQNTPFVRDWPYAANQYPLGNDLWFIGDSMLLTSSNHIFHVSSDPAVDMKHFTVLDGDPSFDVVGMVWGYPTIITLATRLTMPLGVPETQIRYYDYLTLALQHVIPLPDLVVAGVAQPTLGIAITSSGVDASRVYVLATAGTSAALFTVPTP